jgi:hypothetical protein
MPARLGHEIAGMHRDQGPFIEYFLRSSAIVSVPYRFNDHRSLSA